MTGDFVLGTCTCGAEWIRHASHDAIVKRRPEPPHIVFHVGQRRYIAARWREHKDRCARSYTVNGERHIGPEAMPRTAWDRVV